MKKPTKKEVNELIAELRLLVPDRALSYGDALQIARVQATHVRQWAKAEDPNINLIWLVAQTAVPVNFVPSYTLEEESGLTTDELSGRLEIYINQDEPEARQRFSLLHEWKHTLDFYDADVLYSRFGWGDTEARDGMIEAIANDFAAHVLMPTGLVKRLWFETQNIPKMAKLFNVSMEAMSRRVDKLNLAGETRPRPRTYFRRASSLFVPGEAAGDLSCAA
jgi:Zn-dependent peptidase ImmA (M78 family)